VVNSITAIVSFAHAVQAMRKAQRQYDKSQTKVDHTAAKRLEASIDTVWLPQILADKEEKKNEGVTR